jgi:hypothetical protein
MDGRPNVRNDKKVTTCKRCGKGIFKDQPYLWQQRPVPGMVHAACAP